MPEAIRGSVAAERVPLFRQNYGQRHGREVVATLDIWSSQIQKQLVKLASGACG